MVHVLFTLWRVHFFYLYFGKIFYFSVIHRDIFFKSIRPKLSDIYHKSVRILSVTDYFIFLSEIFLFEFVFYLYSIQVFFSWFSVYLSEVTQIAFLSAEYVLLKTKIPLNLWATGPLKISFLYRLNQLILQHYKILQENIN